jgi:hypothetical protein
LVVVVGWDWLLAVVVVSVVALTHLNREERQ